jgi:oligogalacturonide lyase
MIRPVGVLLALCILSPVSWAADAPAVGPTEPPTSWVDPDTGHRVIRLTREPGSASFYFNVNGYTPDGKRMAYNTPEGIAVLDLVTLQAKAVVKGPARAIAVGQRTPTLYFTRPGPDPLPASLWCTHLDTGETRKLADLPPRASLVTINADETLAAGTFIEGDANAGGAYDGTVPLGRFSATNQGEPINKSELMSRRLAAKLPMTMFTLDLRTGQVRPIIEHSTDWLNHLQFSPTDPTLLMYCHEGHWWLVDRIWCIRTDGTQNQLVHRRTLEMEIAGHEWWGADGKSIFYQLHYPKGMQSSFIASYDVTTGARTWFHYRPDQSSIHDNSSPDGKLFCGDGDNQSPWLFLFRPVRVMDRGTIGAHLVQGGYLESEKLVNLARHNYRLEPNPSFTPDQKFIVFRSNMLGPDYVFAVEVAKAAAPPAAP